MNNDDLARLIVAVGVGLGASLDGNAATFFLVTGTIFLTAMVISALLDRIMKR